MVNAIEDIKTKEEAKALITFLLAEKERHYKDIEMISKLIWRIIKEHGITANEYMEAKRKARKYVDF